MSTADEGDLPVALLLPGQGAQHIRMAAGLYGHEPAFTAFTGAMDAVFDALDALGADGAAVRADWLSERPNVGIDHVTRSQILLFAVDHALGVQLRGVGVRFAALLGHSVGEIAAAVLAGVFTLPSAVALMWDRVTRLVKAPPGGMLAVAASAGEVAGYLSGDVVVGAVNAPRQVILAGPATPLEKVADALRGDGYVCRSVPTGTAFHSPMLAAMAHEAVPELARITVSAPQITVYSGYTAAPLTADEVRDPRFWASHPVAPVLFWPALNALLSGGDYLLVEAGPGQGLATVARRHPSVAGGRSQVAAALPARPSGGAADRESMRRLVDRLSG
ncbi:polyketide synthase [Actinosynnema sp. ALI-1.44]|uniref:acyltransferase domain-containing protein n=1 Tax=Actinosynnema sp. ALI-1.44 TaxID=1933779 RepID=UPI00097C47B5|nr:acyltransferase domain-containing protein [Actinosynnema sp. ALI-1.44]ONI77883.1 polyketide synthase [Actinosynnema sp. ALI-1.44]